MRAALTLVCAIVLDASLLERAWATQACAWIVETLGDEGEHKFGLNLSVDAPASVSVRFQGPNFTSGSMGGDMIQLDPGEAKEVDNFGLDVSAGDDLSFSVQMFDHPLSLDELDNPEGLPLAAFTFERKVSEGEPAPPGDLAVKQCKPLAAGRPPPPHSTEKEEP